MSLRWILPGLVSFQQIRVSRPVPPEGEPAVEVGARVEPSDVAARGKVWPAPLILDVAATLQVPVERAGTAIAVKPGQQIAEGQVVAQTGWRGGRKLLAPAGGTVGTVDEAAGFVVLQPAPQEVEVLAGIRGIVEAVSASEVVVAAYGHRVYGALGVGGEVHGTIKVLAVEDRPSADDLGIQFAYSILVTTAPLSSDLLRRAVDLKVKGVVGPSIPVRELANFLGVDPVPLDPNALPKPPIPLMLTEGFGEVSMAKPIADLLISCDGQEGLLVAQQPAYARRSSLVVSLPRAWADALKLPSGLVRLVDPDLLGSHVAVGALKEGTAVYDLASVSIEVREENGTSALVPVVNVEELSPLGS
jgi:hypothetical protein